MLGKLHGFYPEDPLKAWKVDSVLQAGYDLQERWWDVYHSADSGGMDEKKLLDEYLNKHLRGYLGAV